MDDNKLKAVEEDKAPTVIELSMYNIDENQPVGSLIGRLRSDDPNPDDIHYYRFIDGEGAEDNVSFALAGDLLISALVFDYEYKNSYSVRIRSTDNGDDKLWFERSFTININDQIIETFVETTDKGSLMVYPNPFTEKTIVCFPNPGNREYLLIIKDITGKTVRLVNDVTAGEIEIQRDGLSPGLYLLELKGEKTYKARLLVR